MNESPSLFYAYPSDPPGVGETIEGVCQELTTGGLVNATPWSNLSVMGKWVIDEILTTIDRSDIFACDVTRQNPNLLFELGFAIARGKRLWLSLNQTIDQAVHDGYGEEDSP